MRRILPRSSLASLEGFLEPSRLLQKLGRQRGRRARDLKSTEIKWVLAEVIFSSTGKAKTGTAKSSKILRLQATTGRR